MGIIAPELKAKTSRKHVRSLFQLAKFRRYRKWLFDPAVRESYKILSEHREILPLSAETEAQRDSSKHHGEFAPPECYVRFDDRYHGLHLSSHSDTTHCSRPLIKRYSPIPRTPIFG